MKLYQLLVPAYLVCVFIFLPLGVEAAGLVPCGGRGEAQCQACDVTKLINSVVAWLMVVLSIVAALLIMVAGFRLLTSGGNPGALNQAKETFSNILIGFFILLAGWLLIDTLMKALLSDQVYGVWNEIQCVSQPGVFDGPRAAGLQPGTQYTGPTGGGRGTGAQCSAGNTACSVASLMSSGYTEQQANIMSCIAMTESSGIPTWGPFNTRNPGSNSTACGTFQITQTTWNSVRNRPAGCESFSQCTDAACNQQMALQLVQRSRTSYSDWTCPGCNTRAQGCIDRYSGTP
ncbi:hypothetical protein K2Q16_04160 [Patescibacteria group bacterium]|nr:hypothetical protein [Patescibacteria group bacterium]